MTDSSSHAPSSPDPSATQEDEARFAPKPERDETTREKDCLLYTSDAADEL